MVVAFRLSVFSLSLSLSLSLLRQRFANVVFFFLFFFPFLEAVFFFSFFFSLPALFRVATDLGDQQIHLRVMLSLKTISSCSHSI